MSDSGSDDSSSTTPPSSQRGRVGARGEQLAAEFLREEGWSIRERNFENKHGEIDIVAQRSDQLGDREIQVVAFVEVKTRRGGPVLPELSVNRGKRQKLVFLGKLYRDVRDLHHASFRFDVISVDLDGNPPDIQHYPSAFDVCARLN